MSNLDIYFIVGLQVLTFFFMLFLAAFFIAWFKEDQYYLHPDLKEKADIKYKDDLEKIKHPHGKLGAIKRPSAELLEKKKNPKLLETEEAMTELLDKEFENGNLGK